MSTMPYIGLRPFNEDESDIFFGRDEHANELLAKIGKQYFTAVTGLSGCGKSSLIYAGIIPRIQMGYLSQAGIYWRIITMCPGNDPFGNLASALLIDTKDKNTETGYGIKTEYAALFQNPDLKNKEKDFLEGSLRNSYNLQEALSGQGLNIPEETNFLLIVDQFEEIFRKTVNKEEAEQFVKFLLESSWAEYRVYVVITMRSEFIGECAKFYDLAEEINSSFFLVPRLTHDQLKEAIENPIKVYGEIMDSEVVNKILKDSDDEPDRLPIIQHLLMGMWKKMHPTKKYPWTPQKHYTQSGLYEEWKGIKGSLSRHMDKAYNELKEKNAQLVVEYLFKNLIEINDDLPNTRRFLRINEVIQLIKAAFKTLNKIITDECIKKSLLEIISVFGREERNFLKLSTQELEKNSVIYITHESIIRQWEQLQKWKQEEQNSKLNSTVTDRLIKDKVFAKESAQIAEQEKQKAKQQLKTKKLFIKIVTMLLLIIISLSVWLLKTTQQRTRDLIDSNIIQAIFQIRDNQFKTANKVLAENETLPSKSDKLINSTLSSRQQVNKLLQRYTELFGQIQSTKTFPEFESEIYTFIPMDEGFILGGKGGKWGYLNPAKNQFVPYPKLNGDVKAVVFYPTHSWLITGDTTGKITIWDKNITPIHPTTDIKTEITALALGNNVLFAGDTQGQVHHWQITPQGLTQHQVEKTDKDRISTGGLTLNRDKTQLLIAAYEPIVKLWDVSQDNYQSLTTCANKKVYQAVFSDNEKAITTAQANNNLGLYDLSDIPLRTFDGHKDAVFAAQFANDDHYLISGSQDNQIRIWDVESGKTLQTLESHQGTITNLVVKDNELWSAGLDGTVKQWSLKLPYHLVETCIDKTCRTDFDATLIGQPIDYRQHPISVSIAPQGQYIVVGFLDGTLRLYSLPNIELIDEVKKHRDRIRHINFNQNGDLLATASYDGQVGIWELKDGKLSNRQLIPVSDKAVYDVAFSPDSKTIATAGLDGVIRLCSLDTSQCKDTFDKEKTKQALFVQFIDANQLLATINEQAYLLKLDVKQYGTIESAKAENALLGITHSKGYYATYGQEAQLTVYDDKFSKTFQTTAHTDTIYKAIFSPNGQQIATVSSDEKLKMWDLQAKSDDKLLFTIDLPVKEKTQLKQGGTLPQVYDFDFRCTPTGCWIAVPLTHGYIAVYPFGDIYE